MDPGELVRDLVAALNAHDVDRAVGLFGPTCHNHGVPATPETMRAVFRAQRQAIPDLHQEIVDLYRDRSTVVTRSILSGSHAGVVPPPFTDLLFNGALAGLEPRGGRFRIQVIHIWETADGAITGHWANRDDLGMRRQLQKPPS